MAVASPADFIRRPGGLGRRGGWCCRLPCACASRTSLWLDLWERREGRVVGAVGTGPLATLEFLLQKLTLGRPLWFREVVPEVWATWGPQVGSEATLSARVCA